MSLRRLSVRELQHAIEREWGPGKRLCGERYEQQYAVVARDPIQANVLTTLAAMHKRPFAVASRRYRDGFHDATAFVCTIACPAIDVQAVQTMRAVIAMFRAARVRGDARVAVATFELGPIAAAIFDFHARVSVAPTLPARHLRTRSSQAVREARKAEPCAHWPG